MDAKKLSVLSLCLFAVLALAACSGSDSTPTSTEAESPFDALVDEVQGQGSGIGGVKVDSLCSSGCSKDNEDNTIAPLETQYVWIQNGTGVFCNNYRAFLEDRGVQYGSAFPLTFDDTCGDKLRGYTWPAPAAPGVTSESLTMTVLCDETGEVIGSDSFRLIDNDDCEK